MSKINRLSYCNPYRLKAGGKCSIEDATLPLPDMLPYLMESENQPIEVFDDTDTKSISRYDINIVNKYVGQLRYVWTVESEGSASIVEPYDTGSKYIYVSTNSTDDITFTVKCTVTDGIKSENCERVYTHVRIAV